MPEKQKILLAVDGSDQSMAAVNYAAGVLSPAKTEITLFHVEAQLPETFMDQEAVPDLESFEGSVRDWSKLLHLSIEEFMQKAKTALIAEGFDKTAVQAIVKSRKIGYARDILKQSQDGYSALIIGRSGFGKLNTLMMGSIAAKIVEGAQKIPLIVVGGKPNTRKILIAFDRSPSSKFAVKCIASMFDTPKLEVLICHIVRPLNMPAIGRQEIFKRNYEREWVDVNTRKIIPFMVDAKQNLVDAGLDQSRITTSILEEKTSRAEGLFSEAVHHEIGTIVAGRRGLTMVKEFTIGRVSRKILHMAGDKAVWIV